jgi:hypothetical protein
LNSGELPRVGDDVGVSDGVQKRSANLEGSSGCPIASGRRGERRLEIVVAAGCFGRAPACRSTAQKDKRRASRGAPEREEPRGCRNLAAGCLVASESSKEAIGIRKLRRAISSDWRCLGQEVEREMEEGSARFI